MAVFTTAYAGAPSKGAVAQRVETGLNFLNFVTRIPTEALDSNDEQVLLYKFPDDGDVFLFRAIVEGLRVDVDDLDGVASLAWDLGIGDVDGVIDTTLISGSTVGQSAGSDVLDAAGAPLDVSGKYLIWDVTTAAATPQEGDLQISGLFSFGIREEDDESLV